MDTEQSLVDQQVVPVEEKKSSSKDISSVHSSDRVTLQPPTVAWQELLGESALGVDDIEEGPLSDLNDEFETTQEKTASISRMDGAGWKEFISDPSLGDRAGNGGRDKTGNSFNGRNSSGDGQGESRKEWDRFLSTSHLSKEGSIKITSPSVASGGTGNSVGSVDRTGNSFKERNSSGDGQGDRRKEWDQFLSTSYLSGEGGIRMTPPSVNSGGSGNGVGSSLNPRNSGINGHGESQAEWEQFLSTSHPSEGGSVQITAPLVNNGTGSGDGNINETVTSLKALGHGEAGNGVNQKEWNQFLNISHLPDGESIKMTPPLVNNMIQTRRMGNDAEQMAERKQVAHNVRSQSSTAGWLGMPKETALLGTTDFVARANSAPPIEAPGNLPERPLTIGNNETIGASLPYQPISPFDPDKYPPRTASSTPAVPTLLSTSQYSEGILDADIDETRDMSGRERLQPLGRDGLEVKQGPPWGMTMPLFRQSSFSSSDSSSNSGSSPQVRPQTSSSQLPKTDTEFSLPVVTSGISEDLLSRQSSTRSLESKEPITAKALDSTGPFKSRIAKFHELNPSTGDFESPVSRILGPTFKATQRMLEELKRRPLGSYSEDIDQHSLKEQVLELSHKESGGERRRDPTTREEHSLAELPCSQTTTDVERPSVDEENHRVGLRSGLPGVLVGQELDPVVSSTSSYLRQADSTSKIEPRLSSNDNAPVDCGFLASTKNEPLQKFEDTECIHYEKNAGSTELTTKTEPRVLLDNNLPVSHNFSANGVRFPRSVEENSEPKSFPGIASRGTSGSGGVAGANYSSFPNVRSSRGSDILMAGNERSFNAYSTRGIATPIQANSKELSDKFDVANREDSSKKTNGFTISENRFARPKAFNSNEMDMGSSWYGRKPEGLVFKDDGQSGKNLSHGTSGVTDSTLANSVTIPGNVESFNISDASPSQFGTKTKVSFGESGNHEISGRMNSQPDNKEIVSTNVQSFNGNQITSSATPMSSNEVTDPCRIDLCGPTRGKLGNKVAIPRNVESGEVITQTESKPAKRSTVEDTGQENLSWENVLEVHTDLTDLSDLNRAPSGNISSSNHVANRFREVQVKSTEVVDIESDDEGTLVDDVKETMPLLDSGLSESTTNDEIFRPKGLARLTNESGPVGIYDVRLSCGPGSTNRKRLAFGKLPRAVNRPVTSRAVYVSEGTTGTEMEDKVVESLLEEQSTSKTDETPMTTTSEKDESLVDLEIIPSRVSMMNGTIPTISGNFTRMQPLATTEHTWSNLTPVMSQLDTTITPLVSYEEETKPQDRLKNEDVALRCSKHDPKRSSRRREQGKKLLKPVKQPVNTLSSESVISEQSGHGKSAAGHAKKSVADVILENFRRQELEQKKRQKKLEELKQKFASEDLNALWERFQEFLAKDLKKSRRAKSSREIGTRLSPRTPSEVSIASSTFSVVSSTDSPSIENEKSERLVELSTDSDEGFEKFLRRVRNVSSSDITSAMSRTSDNQSKKPREPSERSRRKTRRQVPAQNSSDQSGTTTGKGSSSMNEMKSVSSSERNTFPIQERDSTSTNHYSSDKISEAETPLSLPMWLGIKSKQTKRQDKKQSEQKSVCTCGAKQRVRQSSSKSSAVRDVGVNCPTPPLISYGTNVASRDTNTEMRGINVVARDTNHTEMRGRNHILRKTNDIPCEKNVMPHEMDFSSVPKTMLSRGNGSKDAPPSLVKLSLQDAFAYSKQDFIRRSRERVKNIKEKRKDMSRDVVVVVPTDRTKQIRDNEDGKKTATTKPLKLFEQLGQRKPRTMTQKEIREVNKRIYKNLPEVQKQRDERRRLEYYKTNRLRAQLYGKHVRNTLNRIYTAP